jgi:hypothetical protein
VAALAVAAALLGAAAMWRLWPWLRLPRHIALGTPAWTDPGEQVWNLFHRPALAWAALRQQFRDNLGEGHLTGGWVSVLGVMGWCQYKLPHAVYRSLWWACGLALWCDVARPGRPQLPRTDSWAQALVCRLLPALAPLAVILLVDLAFWVTFTAPGRAHIIGVQGRYYHGALYLIGIGVSSWCARRPWLAFARNEAVHLVATAATLACVASAWARTLGFLHATYWMA